jgi:hypothetical protein
MNAMRGRRGVVVGTCIASSLALFVGLGFVSPVAAQITSRQVDRILDNLDQINKKLDAIQKQLGCPIDDYINGKCTDNPAQMSVTYCISQGRQGELAGKYAIEPKAKIEGGARWDIAALGDIDGELDFPLALVLPPPSIPIPLPTELSVGGSASHGRNFDICVQVPMRVPGGVDNMLEYIVKGINPPDGVPDTKYQRRMVRLLQYAQLRVPPPPSAATTKSAVANADDNDFDILDDAMERFSAGQFQRPDGPLGVLKDPIIQDLRSTLEVPEPVQLVLDDPDVLFESLPAFSTANPGQLCSTLGLSGSIANRSPAVAGLCGLLGGVPTFEVASTAFSTVHDIHSLLMDLPDEVIFGVSDILTSVNTDKLPTPRPPGSPVCNIFPRLCR